MKIDFINQRITAASLTILFKIALFGLISGELWYFGTTLGSALNPYINAQNYETTSFVLSLVVIGIIVLYAYCRNCKTEFIQLIQSKRLDLLVAFLIGGLLSVAFTGITTKFYTEAIETLNFGQLYIVISIPLMMGLLLIARALLAHYMKSDDKYAPFFMSDVEKESKKDDLLGFTENAERFAERVFNGGSSDSIVFGIDAPWGIGKSTFMNFCQEYWQTKHKDQIIVYKFNPLRYEDRTNLLQKFVDGLVSSIQKNTFLPEIRPLISRYSRFIRGKGSISIPGIGLELMPGSYTVDDAFEDLEQALGDMDKKILIIVDDLDRLNFSAIKDVLFVVKKSFTLPNISYVLCYDTDNITALEKENVDPDKVTEFLEKFVNVKVSLYLDNQTLIDYVSDNLEKSLTGNSQADPILISKAMGALTDIYKSENYHKYGPFIGDVRKLKRLINTLMFLEVEHTDFDNSDFDKQDLIHLLLIYINYPSVFRKIYNTETNGKRGFFSLVIPYDEGYPPEKKGSGGRFSENDYSNSTLYNNYIEQLDENPRFLLDQVFNVSIRLKSSRIDDVPEESKHTYACFNGAWTVGRNLEAYLNLIVNLSKPQKREQYRFYLVAKNRLQEGESITNILEGEEFVTTKSEESHQQLWRVIINSLHDFNEVTGAEIITSLLQGIHHYSLFTNKTIGVGLRDDLDLLLISALDTVGWTDPNGKHSNNTQENISEIAEWVFGEGRHSGIGVLETLLTPSRGVMGLYDLMAFRLYCCSDRGGNIFNLTRAIAFHANPSAPTEGDGRIIVIEEMREMSQKVFQMFKEQYITPNKNLFAVIDELTLEEMCGDWANFVTEKIKSDAITQEEADKTVAEIKWRMKLFISYQLGNEMIGHGVGCGYYDESGNGDGHGIAVAFNEYLFELCFNPSQGIENYEHFIDYLLSNFASVFTSEGGKPYIPHINEFTKVLNRQRLAQYWRDNAIPIRALDLPQISKVIEAGNYSASYADLEDVFTVLDKLVADEDAAVIMDAAIEAVAREMPDTEMD